MNQERVVLEDYIYTRLRDLQASHITREEADRRLGKFTRKQYRHKSEAEKIVSKKPVAALSFEDSRPNTPSWVHNPKLPKTIESLLSSNKLWVEVDEHHFVPDVIVKELIVPREGTKKLDRFSTFVADRKKLLASWGFNLLAATNKSRYQYWDEDYARLFLASIIYNSKSYLVREDIPLNDLLVLKQNTLLEDVGKDRTNKIYPTDSQESLLEKVQQSIRKRMGNISAKSVQSGHKAC